MCMSRGAPQARSSPAASSRARSKVRCGSREPALGDLDVGEGDASSRGRRRCTPRGAARRPRRCSRRARPSRSPAVQAASPTEPPRPPRVRSSSSGASASRALGVRRGPGRVTAEQRQRGPVHLDASRAAGRARRSSTTTSRRPGQSVQRLSMSPSRSSTPSNSLLDIRPPTKPDREHRPLRRRTSSGSASTHAADHASCRSRRRSRDRELDQLGGPVDVAGRQRVPDRGHRRRRRRRTTRWPADGARRRRPGCSSSRCARSTSANRWW